MKDVSQSQSQFQFMSDLHLEKEGYSKFHIPRVAPNLILAGDIGNLKDENEYLSLLQRLCARFERVLLVPGNHEYYHMDRSKANEVAATFTAQLGDRFTWMDREMVEIDGVIVLGCTLYSRVNRSARKAVRKEIPDFSYVGEWNIDRHNAEHDRDRRWLKQQLTAIHKTRPHSRVIIATHFPPTWSMTSDPSYADKTTKSFYGSKTLESFGRWKGSDQVAEWIFGHTHWNITFSSASTVVLSNQRHHGSSVDFSVNATI